MITNERADDTRKGPGACQAKISLFGAALLNSGLRASHFMAGLLAKMRLDCQSMTRNSFIWRMLIAEYVGTMLLVLVGCAATVSGWNEDHSISLVGVALTFGILIAGLIVVTCPPSYYSFIVDCWISHIFWSEVSLHWIETQPKYYENRMKHIQLQVESSENVLEYFFAKLFIWFLTGKLILLVVEPYRASCSVIVNF